MKRKDLFTEKKFINKSFAMIYSKTTQNGIKDIAGNTFWGARKTAHKHKKYCDCCTLTL